MARMVYFTDSSAEFPTTTARSIRGNSGLAIVFCAGRRARSAGFTLVEILVTISIIMVLLALFLPVLSNARQQANAATCAVNLRSIGQAFQSYCYDNDNYGPPWRNFTSWFNPSKPNQFIDPYDPNSYWGTFLTKWSGSSREIFVCPSNIQKTDVSGYPNQYTAYGANGWGDAYSGLADSDRLRFFGSTSDAALYRKYNDDWNQAAGQNMTKNKYPTQTILAQDAWEAVLDGGNNGDTFASSDSGNRGRLTEYPGHDIEYLRHMNTSNAVFLDGHVERLTKDQQTDERYYTGHWELPRSY